MGGIHSDDCTWVVGPDHRCSCGLWAPKRPKHPSDIVRLVLRPIGRARAMEFIGTEHRHNKRAVAGWKFGVGLFVADELVGVGIAGRPTARMLQTAGGGKDGHFIEVTRVATDGTENACSKLYGALTRAATALGYCRAYTYTLDRESGASLRASGWEVDARTDEEAGWSRPSRPRNDDEWPEGAKVRWVRYLNECGQEHNTKGAA